MALLAAVLAGKDRTAVLEALGILKPGIVPERALRKALDQNGRRRLLRVSDGPRHGCCDLCGLDRVAAMLEDTPWAIDATRVRGRDAASALAVARCRRVAGSA